jgi:peroxygenase
LASKDLRQQRIQGHGNGTGVYDIDGHFHTNRFEVMFQRWDTDRLRGLIADQLLLMWKRNRLTVDPARWCFAFMELWTTWLLLQKDVQKDGRVWKDGLKGCYDGTTFWKIAEEVEAGRWDKGYGISDFVRGMASGGTWRTWELKNAVAYGELD